MDNRLAQILRAPGTLEDLLWNEGYVVATSGERYPTVAGIPILIEDPCLRAEARQDVDARSGAGPAETEPERGSTTGSPIIEAFRGRASTYFSANYSPGVNPPREARHRLVITLIGRHFPRGGTILEAGAGPAVLGTTLRELAAPYVALDLSLANLLEARNRLGSISCVCADMTALPFGDDTFDAVTAIGCLEYIPQLGTALAELSRVAKAGAPLILSIPNRASPARWWDEVLVNPLVRLRAASRRRPSYKRTLTSRAQLEALLNSARASVDEVHFLNQGLVGYPLSSTALANRLWSAVISRAPRVAALSSELVMLARVRG